MIISFGFDEILSIMEIFIPLFKKANSFILLLIIDELNFVSEKISFEGKKFILVPVFLLLPITFKGDDALPFLNST